MDMNRRNRTAMMATAMVLPALLGGCMADMRPTTTAPPAATEVRALNSRAAGHAMLLQRCPISDAAAAPAFAPAIAPLLLALAPAAGQFIFSVGADYLARLDSERDAVYTAAGLGEIPANGHSCLVITRGHLGPLAATPWEQGSLSSANTAPVGLAGPPDFYMEARLEVVPDPAGRTGAATGGELVLRPQLVHVARSAALRDRAGQKSVGIVVALRPTATARNPSEQSAIQGADAVFTLNLGRLEAGTEIRPASFTPREAAPPPGHPLADLAQRVAITRLPARLNIAAFVTETADPNRLLELLNTAVTDNRDGLQKALTEAIQGAISGALGAQAER
jgi:hypothetical protein